MKKKQIISLLIISSSLCILFYRHESSRDRDRERQRERHRNHREHRETDRNRHGNRNRIEDLDAIDLNDLEAVDECSEFMNYGNLILKK